MKKEKFYYSEPLQFAKLDVVVNEKGEIVGARDIFNRTNKHVPRITICGIYDDKEQTMSYGVSICSKNDIFQKEIGRKLSKSRAEENPIRVVNIVPDQKISDVFISNAREIETLIANNGFRC